MASAASNYQPTAHNSTIFGASAFSGSRSVVRPSTTGIPSGFPTRIVTPKPPTEAITVEASRQPEEIEADPESTNASHHTEAELSCNPEGGKEDNPPPCTREWTDAEAEIPYNRSRTQTGNKTLVGVALSAAVASAVYAIDRVRKQRRSDRLNMAIEAAKEE